MRDGEYDLVDFLAHTKHDVEKLYAEMRGGDGGDEESMAEEAA